MQQQLAVRCQGVREASGSRKKETQKQPDDWCKASVRFLIFLFVLMILGNLSYASFPLNEKEKVLISENIEAPAYSEEKKIWGNLSFYLSILSLLILPDLGSSLLLSISTIIFGIIGLTRKVNWKKSGEWKPKDMLPMITLTDK